MNRRNYTVAPIYKCLKIPLDEFRLRQVAPTGPYAGIDFNTLPTAVDLAQESNRDTILGHREQIVTKRIGELRAVNTGDRRGILSSRRGRGDSGNLRALAGRRR